MLGAPSLAVYQQVASRPLAGEQFFHSLVAFRSPLLGFEVAKSYKESITPQ